MMNSAIISACGLYRYELAREFAAEGRTIGWCLHNPSTADADKDDPTSRRGISFTKSWGGARLIFVNLWAGRATKKPDLWKMADPIGPLNDTHIERVARECAETGGFMVLAWGVVKGHRQRINKVKELIANADCPMRTLGYTDGGNPRHPLFLKGDTQLCPA
jgi:hypothetical protein